MRKTFPILLSVVSLSLASDGLAQSRFVPAPPITPTRGVVSPLIQLPPVASLDLFMSDMRAALQEGSVPDVSLFRQLGRVFDQRHHEIYPDFLRSASSLYQRAVSEYASVGRQQGMTDPQMAAIGTIMTQTLKNAKKMIDAAVVASQNRLQAERVKLESAEKSMRSQFAQYRGNPNTLSMPLLVVPRSAAGDVAPRFPLGARSPSSTLQALADQQLRVAGDRLGSGTRRSNEWLQLLREYRQAEITRDAAVRHFNPQSFDLKSIAP